MGKTKANPRYGVISMRVTEDEKETIAALARGAKMSTSDALRAAAQQAGLFNDKGGQHG